MVSTGSFSEAWFGRLRNGMHLLVRSCWPNSFSVTCRSTKEFANSVLDLAITLKMYLPVELPQWCSASVELEVWERAQFSSWVDFFTLRTPMCAQDLSWLRLGKGSWREILLRGLSLSLSLKKEISELKKECIFLLISWFLLNCSPPITKQKYVPKNSFPCCLRWGSKT